MSDVLRGAARRERLQTILTHARQKADMTGVEMARFDILLDRAEVTSCWLCIDGRKAGWVWAEAMYAMGRLLLRPVDRPQEAPWLAVGMAPSSVEVILARLHRMPEAVGIEEAVAWSLIDKGR